MTIQSGNSVWTSIHLRLTLFRIWFMKNLLLWVEIAAIIIVICMLTGHITETSPPGLGPLCYKIFGELLENIRQATQDSGKILDVFAAMASICLSIALFISKAKYITQSDIKNNKLKLALIKSNLYFNADGRLVKKLEKMTGRDLDGDNKADETEVVEQGLLKNFFYAIKEFVIILTADLSGKSNKTPEDEYKATLEEANLKEAAEGYKEVKETTTNGIVNMTIDETIEEVEKQGEKKKQEATTKEERHAIKEAVDRCRSWLLSKVRKTKPNEDKEENADVEVIVNNIENDSENKIEETKIEEVNNIETTSGEEKKETPVVQQKPVAKPTTRNTYAEEFMRQLRG